MEHPVPNRQTFFLGGFLSAALLIAGGYIVHTAVSSIADLWHDAGQFDECDELAQPE